MAGWESIRLAKAVLWRPTIWWSLPTHLCDSQFKKKKKKRTRRKQKNRRQGGDWWFNRKIHLSNYRLLPSTLPSPAAYNRVVTIINRKIRSHMGLFPAKYNKHKRHCMSQYRRITIKWPFIQFLAINQNFLIRRAHTGQLVLRKLKTSAKN